MHRGRKPMTSLAELDRARIASGVYLDKQEFADAILIPMRRRRRHEEGPREGMTPGTMLRPDGSDPAWEDPAPAWAAHLVLRMARLFFDDMSWANLRVLTQRLVSSEEKAAAAQTVLMSFFPKSSVTGDGDRPLGYVEGTRVWDALENVAWTA